MIKNRTHGVPGLSQGVSNLCPKSTEEAEGLGSLEVAVGEAKVL